jgi:hypothetical protein
MLELLDCRRKCRPGCPVTTGHTDGHMLGRFESVDGRIPQIARILATAGGDIDETGHPRRQSGNGPSGHGRAGSGVGGAVGIG